MTPEDFSLLNNYQRGFPLVPEPFRLIADELGLREERVLAALSRLTLSGAISRIGAVFRPGTIGASTLAAMAVPRSRLSAVADLVSVHAGVNHNYEREHALNLWFVAAAPDAARLARLLDMIRRECEIEVLALPLLEEYFIDLGFDLAGRGKPPESHRCQVSAPLDLDAADRRLVAALQEGLSIARRPYRELGSKCRLEEQQVLKRIAAWQEGGAIRRFGVVVRHRELGYRANAMVVWDVPENQASAMGERLAREQDVNLCYRRARCGSQWPYNLYCMIHGRERDAVRDRIDVIAESIGLGRFPREILFSRRRFKQTGARHAEAAESVHE